MPHEFCQFRLAQLVFKPQLFQQGPKQIVGASELQPSHAWEHRRVAIANPKQDITSMAPLHRPDDDLLQATLALFPRFVCPEGKILWVAESVESTWTSESRVSLNISASDLPTIGMIDLASDGLFLIDVLTIRGAMTPERVALLSDCLSNRMTFSLYTAVWSRVDLAKFVRPPWGSFVWCASEPRHAIQFR